MARDVPGGNYSWPRVGHEFDQLAGLPGPFAFTQVAEFEATKDDAKKWGLLEGKLYRTWKFLGYPIRIEQDVTFHGSNFSQEAPHTDGIFELVAAPGSLVLPVVTFEDHCNLVNVKVPDGVLIHGGNLHHGIDAPTGDPARPVVRLLCECEKCCTALAQLQDDIAAGTLPKNERGMVLHHEMKPRYVERRKDGSKVIDDRARAATGNLDALKKYGQDLSPSLMTTLARGE